MQGPERYLLKAFEGCSVFHPRAWGTVAWMGFFCSSSILNRFLCPLFLSSFSQARSFSCPRIICPAVLVELLVCSTRSGNTSSFKKNDSAEWCVLVCCSPVQVPALQTAQHRARKSTWKEMCWEIKPFFICACNLREALGLNLDVLFF